jgi:hypothetical protein
MYYKDSKLKKIRFELPDANDNQSDVFSRLDAVLVPLLRLQRDMDVIGPLDKPPSDYVAPDAYDVLISDIKPDDLPTIISKAMGVDNLSLCSNIQWPLEGKIWGRNKRVLFTLPVFGRKKCIYVHFIFDTGSAWTYVALATIEALGIPEISLNSEIVKINGIKLDLSVSDSMECAFQGLNLLGMDYMVRIDAKIALDFENMSATINKS